MKKIIFFCGALLISISSYTQSTDDIAIIQGLWGKEKRAIVEQYMDLSTTEATAFWGAYESYETSRKELGRERLEILTEYADSYLELSDEIASDLIRRGIANNISYQKLAKKTFKQMEKTIPSVKAAKFIQLENYFRIAILMEIQDDIPFIGELDDLIIEK